MTSQVKSIISKIWTSKDILSTVIYLSDEIGPRPSGSDAAQKAVDYIKGKFNEYSLNTSIHEFQHASWSSEETHFSIDNREFPSVAFNLSGNGQLSGECYYMANPSKKAFESANFDGKILLAEASHGMGMHRTEILKKAVEGGALAYVQVSKIPGGIVETGNISTGGIAELPAVCISYEAGHFVRRQQLQDKGEVSLIVKGGEHSVIGKNVVGNINNGSEKTIILGAHYDTWENGPGAFDNGTGVATLLELAKAFSDIDKSEINLQFVAFSAEELGFKGSMEYKKEFVNSKSLSVPLMMNFDCTAYPKGTRSVSISNSNSVFNGVNQLIAEYDFESNVDQRPPYGTDGFPFFLSKIPVVSLEQIDRSKPSFMHTAFDTPEKLSEDSLKNSTAIAGAILADIIDKKYF